ncbi:MAG: UDP-N-acetylmuramoyl-L-alanine--D-glutamate ligase [Alicyclobacillaceae bacterium]|nr:UDP-N-acetylmuramoyl-L-alanine--D-glutamate ligase [Alicyclobacillaceae bacterium]
MREDISDLSGQAAATGQPLVLVVGLARSGEAIARLLLRRGYRVLVNEQRERSACEPAASHLETLGCDGVYGGHPLDLLDQPIAFIVKNPGIPYRMPLIALAMERSIPVYTEVEVALWDKEVTVAAITGSNGKTTTTTLLGEMLRHEGRQPVVAGNIGLPVAAVVDDMTADQPLVLEVSSFQLMGTERFHPHLGVFLNLYSAHLDYHGSREAYAAAKWRLFANMTSDDVAIINWDFDELRQGANRIAAGVFPFSSRALDGDGVFVRDDTLFARRNGETLRLLPIEEIGLVGRHNVENCAAAAAAALMLGVNPQSIVAVLREFRGVEHRLEYVRTVAGVSYYNDSKSTNSQAALASLAAFASGVIWIAGGLDRGEDFSPLVDALQNKVEAAILLGQSQNSLAAVCELAGVPQIRCVTSIPEAVLAAQSVAESGQTVLLSPACASWDMFSSFEERGSMFKEAVHRL